MVADLPPAVGTHFFAADRGSGNLPLNCRGLLFGCKVHKSQCWKGCWPVAPIYFRQQITFPGHGVAGGVFSRATSHHSLSCVLLPPHGVCCPESETAATHPTDFGCLTPLLVTLPWQRGRPYEVNIQAVRSEGAVAASWARHPQSGFRRAV